MALLVKKLIEKHAYLSVKGCLKLLEYYIEINLNRVYINGKFQYKHLK